MTTNVDITNRALAQIGTKSQITSLSDGSTEANYANLLYIPLRDFLLREGDYDFSIGQSGASSSTSPSAPWVFSYAWPSGALRIRSVIPQTYNALDPFPVEFNAVWGVQILTRVALSFIIYTVAPANENYWDPDFTEAYTRLLASALAFALENRIEASREKLSEALSFAGIAELLDG